MQHTTTPCKQIKPKILKILGLLILKEKKKKKKKVGIYSWKMYFFLSRKDLKRPRDLITEITPWSLNYYIIPAATVLWTLKGCWSFRYKVEIRNLKGYFFQARVSTWIYYILSLFVCMMPSVMQHPENWKLGWVGVW